MLKYLVSLEETHGKFDLHINNEHIIQWAVKNNNFEMLKYLISLEETHGKFNLYIKNEIIMELVAENNNFEMLKYLISLEETHGKFDLHIKDEIIMECVAENNNFEMLKYLISLEETHGKFDLNIGLYEACRNGNYEIVKYLLSLEETHQKFKEYTSFSIYKDCSTLEILKIMDNKFNIIKDLNIYHLFRIDFTFDTEIIEKIYKIHNFTGIEREYIELMRNVKDVKLVLDKSTYNRLFSINTEYNFDSIWTDDDGFAIIDKGCVMDATGDTFIITGVDLNITGIPFKSYKTKHIIRKINDYSIIRDNNITEIIISLDSDNINKYQKNTKCNIYPLIIKNTPIYDTLFITDVLLKKIHCYVTDMICVFFNKKKRKFATCIEFPLRPSKSGKYIIRKENNDKFNFLLPYLTNFLETINENDFCFDIPYNNIINKGFVNINVKEIPYTYIKKEKSIEITYGKPIVIINFGIKDKMNNIIEYIENMKNNGKYYIDLLFKKFMEKYIDIIALHIPQYMRLIELSKNICMNNIIKIINSETNNLSLNGNIGFQLTEAEKINYKHIAKSIYPPINPIIVTKNERINIGTVPFSLLNVCGGASVYGFAKQHKLPFEQIRNIDYMNAKISKIINEMSTYMGEFGHDHYNKKEILTAFTREQCATVCETIKPSNPWFNPKVLSKCGVLFDDPESVNCFSDMLKKYMDCHQECRKIMN